MDNTDLNRLDTKIQNIENQLNPILSSPLNPATTRSDLLLVEEFHHCLQFIKDRLSAEMASANKPHHLEDAMKRVILLQKAAHAWTEALPVDTDGGGSSLCSFVESCVTDGDSGLAGFTVYENPLFDGVPVDDDDDGNCIGDDSTVDDYEVDEFERNEEDNMIEVATLEDVQELEAVNDSVEKEVLEVNHQKKENVIEEEEKGNDEEQENDDYEDGDEDEGTQRGCYKILFWGVVTIMVWMSVLTDISDFTDNSSVILLTPT